MNGIVAAEVDSRGLRLFLHDGETFCVKERPFVPFCLLDAAAEIPENCTVQELSGSGKFCRMALFDSLESYENLCGGLKKEPGAMVLRELSQQALSITGERLFQAMEFADLRIMAFSVEENDGSVAAVTVADTGGNQEVFSGDEVEVIRQFADRVKSFDPDVLTGFNCCREDLPLLVKRAKKHKLALDCGRDGDTFAARQSRYSAGEKQYSYQRFSLKGRHVADMLHLLQFYDAAHRDLEDITLDAAREYFDIPSGTAAQIILKLVNILLPAYFYRTRELPLGFQDCLLRGSGSALDALLIAGYLERKWAIPLPEAPRPYAGAMAGMENSGVFHHVRHCDVRSLYPSLLLALGQAPARDEANVFLPLLNKLREFRLAAKDQAKTLPPGREKQQAEALQSSFKILINSFYGYLGFAQGCFNDYALAEKITAAGRELLGKLVQTLLDHGAAVIEMDTDGIYFQNSESEEATVDAALQKVLPPGITLEFDAVYPAMYSYKAKNYALLKSDGSVSLTGAALKSRALEPFQRKFIMEVVSAALHDEPHRAAEIYENMREAISSRTIPLEELAKSEVLSDSPENYRRKLVSGSGRRSAAYELALASDKNYRAGDRVKFYVTGSKAKVPVTGNSTLLENAPADCRNENTAYYLAKLESLAEAFGVNS
ncbi:MAG: hypothetical protein E7057_07250 [Lentisphaerae bacterium]|nr:hypothetical protein [Lentisphaerota bacterium]